MLKVYEAMFLLNNSKANKDWEAVAAHVHGILERHGVNIKKSQKWGERKLAYDISGQKRGTYMLVHFEAKGDAIAAIRRDAGLSDTILRTLIVIDEDGDEVPDILGDVAAPPGRRGAALGAEPAKPKPEGPSKADDAKAEEPKAEEPKAEEPKAEEPKAEEPKAEEPLPSGTPDEPAGETPS